jgi:hypothetical protein
MQLQTKTLEIEWTKFKPYASFFIPCLNVKDMKRQIKAECKRMRFKVLIKVVTENRIRGVRVWRLLDVVDTR